VASEGLDDKAIGGLLGVERKTASRWRKRFLTERLAGLEERPRSVGPGAFALTW
jgi:transposase